MVVSDEGQELGQLPRPADDVKQNESNGSDQNVIGTAKRVFRFDHLDRVLERPQLTGITL